MEMPSEYMGTEEEWKALSEDERKSYIDGCSKKKVDSVRIDNFPIETKFDTTPEGYLQGTAIVTRVGVFPYMNEDGTFRYEFRSPEEVFHPDSLATLELKPLTNNHPKQGLVNINTVQELSIGTTGSSINMDGTHVSIPIVITDPVAIKLIKKGKRALSCGYKADTIEAPSGSSYHGIPYTHIQANIRYNHVSLVDVGRAGPTAKIRIDGIDIPFVNTLKEDDMADAMKSVTLDGVEYQAEAKVLEALHGQTLRADEASAKFDALETEKSKLSAERDSLAEKLDSVEKELEAIKKNHVDADQVPAMVTRRVALESFASKCGVEVKADMDDVAVMKAVIMQKSPKAKLDDKDAVYVTARYDSIVEDSAIEVEKKEDAANREVGGSVKGDSAEKPVSAAEAKAAYVARLRAAHKKEGK
jgi:uncharacterized protein